MSYFNSAFSKVFVGTDGFTGLGLGQLGTSGNVLAKGEFAFVDPKTWTVQAPTSVPAGCCPLILASGSLYKKDKVGSHGGYQESNKSKIINPKFVHKFYRVDPNVAQQNVINIGFTPFTDALGAACEKEFLCDETYSLRIDVKGSPALRFLNHNAYLTVDAYTGCCPAGSISPTPVDSTLVMIQWANAIVGYNQPGSISSPPVIVDSAKTVISPFVLPVVTAEDLSLWYAPGTDTTGLVAPAGYTIGGTWDNYVSTGHTASAYAGLTLFGAYYDTKFGDCTFQTSDFYEKEPVRLYASLVDNNGAPCEFEGLCVVTECEGLQAMGLGESVVRDVVLSERYRQNFFHSDLRIREITQGSQILDIIDRDSFYTRYYLQHSVPRYNNPSGTFDTDQYLLEIITDGVETDFEDFVNDWLDNCGDCAQLEVVDAITACVPLIELPA
jgi:hypothetical protein